MANKSPAFCTLLFTLSALAACGPCVDSDRTPAGPGGGSVIVAADMCDGEGSTDGSETGSESGGASETSAAPTGGDDSSTGDIEPVVCTALPGPGEAWGPCIAGACNPGAGFCHSGEFGTLCMPACDQGCPLFKCIGGECRADGACVPPCVVDSDCPLPGMQCDKDAPQFPMCVHPE